MTELEAAEYHGEQIRTFAFRIDFGTVMTLDYSDEAVEIVQAAKIRWVPVVVLFACSCLTMFKIQKQLVENFWAKARSMKSKLPRALRPGQFLSVSPGL